MAGERILVVDDHAVNLKLARVLLEGKGFVVRTAADAEEALEAVRDFHPDLVLMDVQLPGMDGLELTRRLKADPATAHVAIVALTAYAMKGDEEKARAAGCDGYITKPIDTRTLPAVIAGHLGGFPPAERPTPLPRRARLLVVEDNPISGKMLRLALEAEGYAVTVAETGAQALEAVRAQPPDLVVQDLILPDLDGVAVLDGIRNATAGRHVPVILLSGRTSRLEELQAAGGTFDDYLTKPVEPSRLLQVIALRLQDPGRSTEPVSTGREVLVVDDEPNNRKLANLRLRHEGFSVTLAEGGGVALLAARARRPDALLSDILMPGMDGFQLCLAFRRDPALASVPVVLASASYVGESDRELARSVGASELIEKSPDYRDAADAIRRALAPDAVHPAPSCDVAIEPAHRARLLDQLDRQVRARLQGDRRNEQQAATLSVLGGICEALSRPLDLESVLSEILVHCLDATGLSTGVLYVREPDGGLRIHGLSGLSPSAASALASPEVSAEIFRLLEPEVTAPKVLSRGTASPLLSILDQPEALVIPLVSLGTLRGALVLASDSERPSDPSWLTFARTLSVQLGEAIALSQALATLAESEGRYRTLVEHASEGIFQATLDGRYLTANPALAAILGYESTDDLIRSVTDIGAQEYVDPADRAGMLRRLEMDGAVSGLEVRLRRKDGSVAWVRMSARAAGKPGSPTAYVEGIVEDVTARRAVEEALRRSEESYRTLFDASPLPMWVYDPVTLRITAVNDAALEQYGYAREEMLAMTILDVRPPEFQDAVRDAVRTQPAGRHHAGVWKHRRKDGSFLDVDVHSNIVRVSGRELRLVLLQDVTALKSLEEQFRQSQKMEALGRLAGGVAHDFNNLLTVINGVAESLVDQVPEGSAVAVGLAEIAAAGWRAADLSRQLLAFSRKQLMRREALDLSAVVEALGSILRRILGEDIVLVTDLASGLRPVLADRGQMEQVLVNLVVNARDAMPRGGRLEIRTGEVEVLEGPEQPGPHVEVSVGDDGSGIDPDVMPRLFEPFFTTKEPGKGTGLGLATVYGIVKQCGGHVVVESRLGEGSTFRVRLPAELKSDPSPGETSPGRPPTRATGSGTVLLVEDEAALRRLAARVLRARGFAVLEAASPTDALALLKSHAGSIDVLVTDVVMPTMDGAQLALRTEALRPGIRVVFMSGYLQDSSALQGRLEARAGFLPKPFRPEELAVKVREVLEG